MILLTTQRIASGPNVASVNDLYASMGNVQVDPYRKVVSIEMDYGNNVGGVFVRDIVLGPAMIVTANTSSDPATWSASNAQGYYVSGTIPQANAAPLIALITTIQNVQATVEGFLCVPGGLLPGTYQAG